MADEDLKPEDQTNETEQEQPSETQEEAQPEIQPEETQKPAAGYRGAKFMFRGKRYPTQEAFDAAVNAATRK
jgi:hypothetical protein